MVEINKIYNKPVESLVEDMISDGNKVNLILTSPPYSTSRDRNKLGTERAFKEYDRRYDVYVESKDDDEYLKWTVNLFQKFDKILAQNGVILYNMNYGNDSHAKKTHPNELVWKVIVEIINKTNFTIGDKITWVKGSALPNNASPNKLTRKVEEVFVFCRKSEYKTYLSNKGISSYRKNGQAVYKNINNLIYAKNNDGVNPYNKATFSTDLVSQLLEIYGVKRSDTNNVIFDPFMGTGTTANASVKLGFNYIGAEISANQVKYAEERIKETLSKI